jgi:hypothetical protein
LIYLLNKFNERRKHLTIYHTQDSFKDGFEHKSLNDSNVAEHEKYLFSVIEIITV